MFMASRLCFASLFVRLFVCVCFSCAQDENNKLGKTWRNGSRSESLTAVQRVRVSIQESGGCAMCVLLQQMAGALAPITLKQSTW